MNQRDGIVDYPLRAALALLVIGLAGPTAVLHQPIGQLLNDDTAQAPASVAEAPVDS